MKKKNGLLRQLVTNIDVLVAALMLGILVVLTSYGAVMRYVVGKPLTWLEEVQPACMVWIVFAAAGAAFRTRSHVAIEIVVELLPKKLQRIMEFFIALVVTLTIGYFCYQSIGFIRLFIRSGRSTSMLNIPYWLIYGIAPVSCLLMLVSYYADLAKRLKEGNREVAQ